MIGLKNRFFIVITMITAMAVCLFSSTLTVMAAECTHENSNREILLYAKSGTEWAYGLFENCPDCNNSNFLVRDISPDTNELVQVGSCFGEKMEHWTVSYQYEGKTYTSDDYVHYGALGHDWGEWTENWSDDNSQLTISRVCSRDAEHKQEYTSTDISNVTKSAGNCVENEVITYTASFESLCLGDMVPKSISKDVEKLDSKDSNNHKGSSSLVNVKAASCKEKGYSGDTTCDSCGAVITAGSEIDKTEHNWNQGEITTAATCKNKGIKTYTCTGCAETKTEDVSVNPEAHTIVIIPAVEATCSSSGLAEGKKCSECDTIVLEQKMIDALGHSYGEWEPVSSATCTTQGNEKRVCTVCGYVDMKSITGNHSWNSDYTVDKQPTCTEDGSKSIHCKNCEAVKDSTVIEKTNHSFGDWKTEKENSCTSGGTRTRKCSQCGIIENENTEPKDHIWSSDYTVDKQPTCTEDGSKSIHCKDCEAVKDATVIEKTNHSFGEWKMEKEASCTSGGIRTRKCSQCDKVENENINPSEHSWNSEYTIDIEPTCIKEGSKSIHCSKCGENKDNQSIDALGHTYTNQTVDGAIKEICVRCGAVGKIVSNPDNPNENDDSGENNNPNNNDDNPNPSTPTNPVTEQPVNPYGDSEIESIVDGESAYTVSIKKNKYTYTGKAIKPTVTVYDEDGVAIKSKNYKITYSNNVNVGVAVITITMKGDYAGTVLVQNFYIIPKGTSISKLTQTTEGIKVDWKANSNQITGYQIQYSTNSKFKNYKTMTVTSGAATTKVIKDLTPGTKYYVRIRTFNGEAVNRICSNWSSSKSITVK